MNGVYYKGEFLMKNSEAYDLWEQSKKDPKALQKLDQHLRTVNQLYEKMHGKMPEHLVNFKIGNQSNG